MVNYIIKYTIASRIWLDDLIIFGVFFIAGDIPTLSNHQHPTIKCDDGATTLQLSIQWPNDLVTTSTKGIGDLFLLVLGNPRIILESCAGHLCKLIPCFVTRFQGGLLKSSNLSSTIHFLSVDWQNSTISISSSHNWNLDQLLLDRMFYTYMWL